MKSIDVQVRQPHGIHLRVASAIVQALKGFKSKVFISKDGKKAQADSVLELVLLEATENSNVRVSAQGEDEDKAVKSLGEFFSDGAGI